MGEGGRQAREVRGAEAENGSKLPRREAPSTDAFRTGVQLGANWTQGNGLGDLQLLMDLKNRVNELEQLNPVIGEGEYAAPMNVTLAVSLPAM